MMFKFELEEQADVAAKREVKGEGVTRAFTG
jgi:hypothetical protein